MRCIGHDGNGGPVFEDPELPPHLQVPPLTPVTQLLRKTKVELAELVTRTEQDVQNLWRSVRDQSFSIQNLAERHAAEWRRCQELERVVAEQTAAMDRLLQAAAAADAPDATEDLANVRARAEARLRAELGADAPPGLEIAIV